MAADVGSISGNDLIRIIPIVMIVLALLLAIVLRSLVAPLYLVVSVGLSYLASLGLAVLVFELIGGQDGHQLRAARSSCSSSSWRWARTTTSWS